MATVRDNKIKELREKYLDKTVLIKGFTFGQGYVRVDDTGVVIDVPDVDVLTIRVHGSEKHAPISQWNCHPDDVDIATTEVKMNRKVLDYIEFYKRRLTHYYNERDGFLREKQVLEEQLYRLTDNIAQVNMAIKSHIGRAGAIDKEKMYNSLMSLADKFTDIRFDGCTVIGVTAPVEMKFENDDGKIVTVPLGVYEVHLNIINGVTFKHVSGEHSWNTTCMHPHINEEGTPCWGTWFSTIQRFHGEQNYMGELGVCYDFLCSADRNGWFVSGYAFAKDAMNRCTECWYLSEECECDICEHCGRPSDDCECTSCPNTGDLLDDDRKYCEGCDHLDEEGICNY